MKPIIIKNSSYMQDYSYGNITVIVIVWIQCDLTKPNKPVQNLY